MAAKHKQQWSDEETQCFLALWSSEEVQGKLDGATRVKPVFQELQREMSTAGYERSVDQLINKLKKLKKDYRDQKKELGRDGICRQKRWPHFTLMNAVLSERPSKNGSRRALSSATAGTDPTVLDSAPNTPGTDPALSTVDLEAVFPHQPSPVPSCSSPAPSCRSSASSTKSRKRRRDVDTDLLQYLERSEERFIEQNQRDQDLANAMLRSLERMAGLMGRMVSVLESQAKKK
ncbi:uncharacterized protein LOC114468223 [Gouania willdenowi]|uniref:uncharacterized protein LOC114468223 n=1 Tax=Gouania willdenowi TaxID=441366 RepID=UPI00105611E5|nr:uncharacterized protein LOC114468223 [Gouania willdenowi]